MYQKSEIHKHNAKAASVKGNLKLKQLAEERKIEYYKNPILCKCGCKNIIKYEAKSYGKFYSQNCSAKYNNKNRELSKETKLKISNSLLGNIPWNKGIFIDKSKNSKNRISWNHNKICNECKNEFIARRKQIYCSAKCRHKSLEVRLKTSIKAKERVANGTHQGWQSRKIRSYPEIFFEQVLCNNNISFDTEYKIKKSILGFNDASNYFLDFYMSEHNLDLEIDGKQHDYPDRKLSDTIRDKALKKIGIIVYRIKWKNPINDKNKEYIKNEINKFLIFYNKIKNEVTSAIQSE